MVDTSRGYADLLTLFPDNTSRAIHPQSMRDLIESIAHPVAGGLRPSVGNDEAAFGVLSQQTLAPGQGKIIPLKIFKDPNGWAITSSYTVGSETIPANSSIVPPPGVYMVSTDFLTVSDAADDPRDGARNNSFRLWFDWIDWDVVANVNDPVYAGDGYFYYPTHGARAGQAETIGQYRQTQEMYDGGQGFLLRAHNYSAVTNMVINYTDIFMTRIV